ncbi:N-acetylmuramoyl-L-alanine amidase [Streptomyces sp. KLOTTS4A1]|uniref:peptidoglycan recognition protein family protein n=1 Tax=Streptomyces sp. KLOTTS4A1 TaxID=3390996 RepID=UPI0039F470F8
MSPRGTRARRASSTRRTVWLAAGVAVLAGTGVTAIAVTGDSGDDDGKGNGRPAQAHSLRLDGKDPKKRELPRTETQSFSLVGVSWEDSDDTFEGTAQIRTRSAADGTWTDWRDLEFGIRAPESAEGDDAGVRGASEPLWVGPSDGVEARVIADGEETAVPEALRLDMVDPGTTEAEATKGDKGKGNGKGKPTAKPEHSKKPGKPAENETTDPAPSEGTDGGTSGGGDAEPTPPPTTDPTTKAPGEEPTGAPATSDTPAEPEPTTEPATEPTTDEPTEPPAETGGTTTEPTAPAPTDEPTPQPSSPQDPDPTDPAPSTDPADETTTDPEPEPTAPVPSTSTEPPAPTTPTIVSRAEWGADESLVQDPPAYLDDIDAMFVHHTAGTNDYDCSESTAIIRAIMIYHVKENGWNDVGYNFFVDKCGTIFEGRAGGVDKPVRGAHTYGFNSYSSGVSVLGNHEDGGMPSAAAKQAVADIAAWKLGLHGVDPEAKVTLTAKADTGVWNNGEEATLFTVSGHRDGYNTLCPGKSLYAALPEIRTAAGASPYATN